MVYDVCSHTERPQTSELQYAFSMNVHLQPFLTSPFTVIYMLFYITSLVIFQYDPFSYDFDAFQLLNSNTILDKKCKI